MTLDIALVNNFNGWHTDDHVMFTCILLLRQREREATKHENTDSLGAVDRTYSFDVIENWAYPPTAIGCYSRQVG